MGRSWSSDPPLGEDLPVDSGNGNTGEEGSYLSLFPFSFACMETWKNRLGKAFQSAARSVILGVGNDLKADDGVGPYIIERLQGQIPENIDLINASTVPENFITQLVESRPDFILIIDAALMKAKPGTIRLIDKDTIGGIAFSTHQLPLAFFIEYLLNEIPVKILVLGVQPLTDEFAKPLSQPVKEAAQQILDGILTMVS